MPFFFDGTLLTRTPASTGNTTIKCKETNIHILQESFKINTPPSSPTSQLPQDSVNSHQDPGEQETGSDTTRKYGEDWNGPLWFPV